MTSIGAGGLGVDITQVRKLDVSGMTMRKLSEEEIAKFRQVQENMYKRPVNLQDHPSQKIYAEVVVNGKSVAKLYNSGAMETSNANYGRIARLDSVADPQGTGLMLAQDRAEAVAKALGGTVVVGADAMSAAEYRGIPPIEFEIDYAAMGRDQKAREASSATLFQTQILAQQDIGNSAAPSLDAADKDDEAAQRRAVIDEFLEFAALSPEEKMRVLILKGMGLTEEELANMPPEEQAKVEEKIRLAMEDKIKESAGVVG
ncbi:MAG: hypothetical protein KJ667_08945 [Alphaproteobacteria bacterium]|nr:hypothetical protein [Alphaproteobacteria bacterium]